VIGHFKTEMDYSSEYFDFRGDVRCYLANIFTFM